MTNGVPATVAEPLDTTEFRDVEARLKERFPVAIVDVERAHGEVDFTVRSSDLLAVARFLRDEPGLEFIHGPGCPVCVLPMSRVDECVELAERPGSFPAQDPSP